MYHGFTLDYKYKSKNKRFKKFTKSWQWYVKSYPKSFALIWSKLYAINVSLYANVFYNLKLS